MDSRKPCSILLIDDDLVVLQCLAATLADFAPVRFAISGKTGLKLARKSTPDLVLLDVDMPELNGFEVCKAFKADPALARVPIIFLSGHESLELRAQGFKLGAVDFITKPSTAAEILARVRVQTLAQVSQRA